MTSIIELTYSGKSRKYMKVAHGGSIVISDRGTYVDHARPGWVALIRRVFRRKTLTIEVYGSDCPGLRITTRRARVASC